MLSSWLSISLLSSSFVLIFHASVRWATLSGQLASSITVPQLVASRPRPLTHLVAFARSYFDACGMHWFNPVHLQRVRDVLWWVFLPGPPCRALPPTCGHHSVHLSTAQKVMQRSDVMYMLLYWMPNGMRGTNVKKLRWLH
jgi:hypothetical protein